MGEISLYKNMTDIVCFLILYYYYACEVFLQLFSM